MQKVMMRFVFCSTPAIGVGAVAALIDIGFGAILAVAVFCFGVDVTRARKERDEF